MLRHSEYRQTGIRLSEPLLAPMESWNLWSYGPVLLGTWQWISASFILPNFSCLTSVNCPLQILYMFCWVLGSGIRKQLQRTTHFSPAEQSEGGWISSRCSPLCQQLRTWVPCWGWMLNFTWLELGEVNHTQICIQHQILLLPTTWIIFVIRCLTHCLLLFCSRSIYGVKNLSQKWKGECSLQFQLCFW